MAYLEQADAFVVSLDAHRSWFRYHRLFADLPQLELQRTAPGELSVLHAAAAGWLAEHGHPVEAVRQAQAAEDWPMAARLLADHWLDLYLGGRGASLVELLTRFPSHVVAASAELTAVQVAGDLVRGALDDAGRHLAAAAGAPTTVPADRRGRVEVMLSVLRLFLARRFVDFPVVAEEAQRLLTLTESADTTHLGLTEDLRAAAFISLGIAEMWALRLEDAEGHLNQGVALARQIGRPYLELHGLAHGAHAMLLFRPGASQAEWSRQAIELAERHGWDRESLAGMAYAQLGIVLLYQGQLDEAEPWLERAEGTLRTEVEPAAGMSLRYGRAVLELARGHYEEVLADLQTAEWLGELIITPSPVGIWTRAYMLMTLLRFEGADAVEQALAEIDGSEREPAEIRTVEAELRLAQNDPQAATATLAPVLNGAACGLHQAWHVQAFLLEAIARDALGNTGAAGCALERALDLAESDGMFLPFLLHPTPLLERHAPHSTTHASLTSEILNRQARGKRTSVPGEPQRICEPLSESELRVLRYLPSNLIMQQIANELYVSVNTVKAHARHLYAKLGVHSRGEAVEQARACTCSHPRDVGPHWSLAVALSPGHLVRPTFIDTKGPRWKADRWFALGARSAGSQREGSRPWPGRWRARQDHHRPERRPRLSSRLVLAIHPARDPPLEPYPAVTAAGTISPCASKNDRAPNKVA
jgi:LuxR family transcriptional regulator, maltose regulon positive regulatory protein